MCSLYVACILRTPSMKNVLYLGLPLDNDISKLCIYLYVQCEVF